jgi:hypothetical protein
VLTFDGWHRYPIGTWSFGRCDRVDDDHVVTDFVCVIVPVWPLRSYYAHRQGDRDKYEEIRLNGRSVALGYARALTWMAAWLISLAVVCAWRQWGWMWPIAGGLCVAGTALQFATGRLDGDEQERRRLLRRVVGLGAPPALLPPAQVDATRLSLLHRWRDDHPTTDWRDAIGRGHADELLVAIAEYSLDAALAVQARMNLVDAELDLN